MHYYQVSAVRCDIAVRTRIFLHFHPDNNQFIARQPSRRTLHHRTCWFDFYLSSSARSGPLPATRYEASCAVIPNFLLVGFLDRFQWGTIISRFSMGWLLIFLLLLNVGKYQSLWVYTDQKKRQAGVFLWILAYVSRPEDLW
jgi:hypothetical protein